MTGPRHPGRGNGIDTQSKETFSEKVEEPPIEKGWSCTYGKKQTNKKNVKGTILSTGELKPKEEFMN